MRQRTLPEQTSKLISLGFPKPNGFGEDGFLKHGHYRLRWDDHLRFNYSIGELLSFLPSKIELDGISYDRIILGDAVIYGNKREGDAFVESDFHELIDNIYLLLIDLKDRGVL